MIKVCWTGLFPSSMNSSRSEAVSQSITRTDVTARRTHFLLFQHLVAVTAETAGWCSYRQVLKEPGSQDVGGHFGEDSSFLVVQSVFVGVVVVPCAGRRHAVIQAVTWSTHKQEEKRELLSFISPSKQETNVSKWTEHVRLAACVWPTISEGGFVWS